MAMDNDQLTAIVGNYLTIFDDYAQGALIEERREALNYIFMRPRGDEVAGQSTVISGDVGDMIESIVAQVMPSFGSDNPCEFEPTSEGDEEQAPAESMAVNKIWMEDNHGYQINQGMIRDALMFGNGVVKCWVEESEQVTSSKLTEVPDAEALALLVAQAQDRGMDAVVEEYDGTEATLKLTQEVKKVRLKGVEQAMFIVDPNHDGPNFEECDFVAERKIVRRSDLMGMGFDRSLVDDLPALGSDLYTDALAKNLDGVEDWRRGETEDRDRIELFECYLRIDMDGDGVSELHRVWYVENVILEVEDAEFIPYATAVAWPVTHRYHGLSAYNKGKDIQDIKTHTLRTMLDNQRTNNVARTAVNDRNVNLDDMISGRVNGIIRVDGIPQENIFPMPTNDTQPSSQALLGYMDKVRSERMGGSLDLQAGDDQLLKAGITAQSVDRQLSEQEQIAALIARNIAESGIRETCLLIHRVMRTQYQEPVDLQIAGQWQQVNPGMWPMRTRVNVKLGLSPGERFRKAGHMMTVIQLQDKFAQTGGMNIIVDQNGMHRAALDWARAVEIDGAEKYFIDPESQRSQQAQQQAAQSQQQQQQTQLQMAMIEPQLKQQEQQFKQQIEGLKLQFEYWKELLNSEIEEAKLVGQATADLEAAQRQGEANTNGTG